MQTITVQISDFEYNQLGLKTNRLSLSELIEKISKKLTRQTLEKSIELASENELSKMTMEEIDEEVKARTIIKEQQLNIEWH